LKLPQIPLLYHGHTLSTHINTQIALIVASCLSAQDRTGMEHYGAKYLVFGSCPEFPAQALVMKCYELP
jgi:hypothetical protein